MESSRLPSAPLVSSMANVSSVEPISVSTCSTRPPTKSGAITAWRAPAPGATQTKFAPVSGFAVPFVSAPVAASKSYLPRGRQNAK